ncbi:hypothetical protein QDR37_03505 [Amnibacterium sp. CER49]|uniref:hypothetical protein n=1 Tax=Amnibacterium sp. CER49 TaxID=3039161 RepID=UPI002448F1EF|nr:hypothetical protein [Amnibacterium sp. CER49]MDH2443006.1 hypothetical protein [Amnibacterium sp. CER49]
MTDPDEHDPDLPHVAARLKSTEGDGGREKPAPANAKPLDQPHLPVDSAVRGIDEYADSEDVDLSDLPEPLSASRHSSVNQPTLPTAPDPAVEAARRAFTARGDAGPVAPPPPTYNRTGPMPVIDASAPDATPRPAATAPMPARMPAAPEPAVPGASTVLPSGEAAPGPTSEPKGNRVQPQRRSGWSSPTSSSRLRGRAGSSAFDRRWLQYGALALMALICVVLVIAVVLKTRAEADAAAKESSRYVPPTLASTASAASPTPRGSTTLSPGPTLTPPGQ